MNHDREIRELLRPQSFVGGELRLMVSDGRRQTILSSRRQAYPVERFRAKLEVLSGTPLSVRADTTPLSQHAIDDWVGGRLTPVNAGELFGALVEFFGRYHGTKDQRTHTIAALYTMGTYLYTAVDEVPYLHYEGEPDAGKTQLAKLYSHVVYQPVMSAAITAAAITRCLERKAGTLLLDEQSHGANAWSGVLRAGYRKGMHLIVAAPGPSGVIERPTYGPKLLFTNDPLHDSPLAGRTIRILMLSGSRAPNRYDREEAEQRGARIREDLHFFALENVHAVRRFDVSTVTRQDFVNRELDLGALLLGLAAVVDDSSPDARTADDVVSYLQSQSQRRRTGFGIDAVRPALVRCIRAFAGSSSAKTWHRADEFADFVNASQLLPRPIGPRQLGQLLNGFGLLQDRRVQDVREEQRRPSDPTRAARPRLQKQHYRFNEKLVDDWCRELNLENAQCSVTASATP